jgi:hypothetical protein
MSSTLKIMPRWITQISPGAMSITPNSVRKRSLFSCATTRSSPSALKKYSLRMDAVTSSTCAAMPARVSASPAVVMVRRPLTKVSVSCGIGIGLQRSCPIGRSLSSRAAGAVRMNPLSILR